jgi:hypothetical protein
VASKYVVKIYRHGLLSYEWSVYSSGQWSRVPLVYGFTRSLRAAKRKADRWVQTTVAVAEYEV